MSDEELKYLERLDYLRQMEMESYRELEEEMFYEKDHKTELFKQNLKILNESI